MNREPECYGQMFPSVVALAHNKTIVGKVFGYEVNYSGQVAEKRAATVDRDGGDLDGCYRLSTGTMLMELAVKTSPQSQ